MLFPNFLPNLVIIVWGTWYVCQIFSTTGSLVIWVARMWQPNLVVIWKNGMASLPWPEEGSRHIHCKGSQLTLRSHDFSGVDMCHSNCTLMISRSIIHSWPIYASTRIVVFNVSASFSHISWPSILSSGSLPLGIKKPSSKPIHFPIIVLWLAVSLRNRALMISDLIVHPPLIPLSMLAWSCIENDINHLQHSILFPGPSTIWNLGQLVTTFAEYYYHVCIVQQYCPISAMYSYTRKWCFQGILPPLYSSQQVTYVFIESFSISTQHRYTRGHDSPTYKHLYACFPFDFIYFKLIINGAACIKLHLLHFKGVGWL